MLKQAEPRFNFPQEKRDEFVRLASEGFIVDKLKAAGEGPYGAPITTVAELDTLDPDEMLEGFRDGVAGEPEPMGNRSRSYWHGWRNGAVDGGHREKDVAMAMLAAACAADIRTRRGG